MPRLSLDRVQVKKNLDQYRDMLHNYESVCVHACARVEGKQRSAAVPSNASAKHMAERRTGEGGAD